MGRVTAEKNAALKKRTGDYEKNGRDAPFGTKKSEALKPIFRCLEKYFFIL